MLSPQETSLNPRLIRLIASAFLLTPVTQAAPRPDADALLKAAEYIRSPQEDYRTNIQLSDAKNGANEVHTYEGLIKGHDKALVRFLSPPGDRGTKVLLVDNDMWVYLPTTAKPIRISPRQRLTGNAAYGDIVRLNFIGNYTAKFAREDNFKGRKAEVLELTAIEGKPVTYDRVEYWVDAKTKSPLKALYESSAGKVLREGYFDKFASVMGVKRPTRMTLVDHLEPHHTTILVFSGAKKANLPDLLFEKENFARD